MYARYVAPVVAGLMVLSAAAYAASSTTDVANQHGRESGKKAAAEIAPYNHCVALQKQFDAAAKTHSNAAKFREANEDRVAAGKLCGGNQVAAGIQKMTKALNDIGVKPKA